MAKDLFSEQAKDYALFRPAYPEELFIYILSFVTKKDVAWDCATGNGQSALPLSQYFKKVVASDISKKQLEQAPKKENIEYVVCSAEQTPFPANSFDLISVSQAYHWLDWEKFNAETTRVGKANCLIAVWMYDLLFLKDEKLNDLIFHFYKNVTGPYWDKERKHIDDHYSNVRFEFDPLPAKEFFMEKAFTKEQLFGYFSTWSATQNFIKANGKSPIEQVTDAVSQLWQPGEIKIFQFLIYLKLGRIIK